jgi:hypothetical protein
MADLRGTMGDFNSMDLFSLFGLSY